MTKFHFPVTALCDPHLGVRFCCVLLCLAQHVQLLLYLELIHRLLVSFYKAESPFVSPILDLLETHQVWCEHHSTYSNKVTPV